MPKTRPIIGAMVSDGMSALHMGRSTQELVNTRLPKEFTGEWIAPPGLQETAQQGSHIPGAGDVPLSSAANPDGAYESAKELMTRYAGARDAGQPLTDIATHCFTSDEAVHTWFAPTHMLGYANVHSCDGSWTGWGNLVSAPFEQGLG